MGFLNSFTLRVRRSWHLEAPRMLFNVLIAFLITFTLAHLYSLFVPFYVFIAGYHIHHFYHGMLLLAVAAIVGLVTNNDDVKHFFSYVTGVGIGLIIDELGLLLNCTGERVDIACEYLFPNRFDIVAIVSVVLLIFIFFGDRPIRWFLPRSWQSHPALNRSFGENIRKVQEKLSEGLDKKKK